MYFKQISIQKIKNFRFFLGEKVWVLFVLATVLGVLWFLVESGFILIIQSFLMSIGLVERSKTMLPSWFPSEILYTTLILIGFGIVRGLVLALRYYFAVAAGQSFISYQRSRILEFGLRNAPNMSTSEIILAFGEHTNTASIALQQIAQLINNFVSIVLFVCAGFYLTPKEFILSIFLLSLALVPINILNKSIYGIGRTINDEKEKANRVLVEGLKNNFFLQIYHLLAQEINRGCTSLFAYEAAYKKYGRVAGLRNAFPQIIGAAVIAIVAFISLKFFETPGSKLLSFFYIFIRMSQCASEFYSVTGDIKIQMVGLRALYSWSERLNDLVLKDRTDILPNITFKDKFLNIEAENLGFAINNKVIFEGLNFRLNVGDVLLIKGESGAGKSTLLSLILGLKIPSVGRVTVNEVSPHLMRDVLCEKIGYVGPEPYLVAGTIRENLLYGHPIPQSISDKIIWESLDKAQLSAEVSALPFKLDEELLETTQLSTGQKQRVSIARALVRSPSILILDEATANLDPETEAKVINILSGLTVGMITIVVSHKDSFNLIATKEITLKKIG